MIREPLCADFRTSIPVTKTLPKRIIVTAMCGAG
jgi:hypothetical protein